MTAAPGSDAPTGSTTGSRGTVRPLDDTRLGDHVRMRKSHPCGADTWIVVRVGADIGLRCDGCARKVLLPRHAFRKQRKAVLARGPEQPDTGAPTGVLRPPHAG